MVVQRRPERSDGPREHGGDIDGPDAGRAAHVHEAAAAGIATPSQELP